jgi:hypothetical protein
MSRDRSQGRDGNSRFTDTRVTDQNDLHGQSVSHRAMLIHDLRLSCRCCYAAHPSS